MGQLTLDEPIQVLVDFHPSPISSQTGAGQARRPKVIPRAFLWKNRRYLIQSLSLVYQEKQGDAIIYYFSVSTDTNTYKLSFHNLTLEWRLVEAWYE